MRSCLPWSAPPAMADRSPCRFAVGSTTVLGRRHSCLREQRVADRLALLTKVSHPAPVLPAHISPDWLASYEAHLDLPKGADIPSGVLASRSRTRHAAGRMRAR